MTCFALHAQLCFAHASPLRAVDASPESHVLLTGLAHIKGQVSLYRVDHELGTRGDEAAATRRMSAGSHAISLRSGGQRASPGGHGRQRTALTPPTLAKGPHRAVEAAACRRTSAGSHAISIRSGGWRASDAATASRAVSATSPGVLAPVAYCACRVSALTGSPLPRDRG